MFLVESSGITDVGRKRKGNEDSLFLDDGMGFYVVADGMGGHKAGEVASRIVVETLRDHIQKFKDGETRTQETDANGQPLSNAAGHLISGVFQANRSVYQKAQSDESFKGMGSTVSAVFLSGGALIASNVGDSPIYLFRNQGVETLSVPHTLAAEHAAMAPEGAKPLGKQFRHMLTRAMGVEETVKPDIREIEPLAGDTIVICSDGLSDNVNPEEIRDIAVGQRPEQACRSLVDLSNSRGGHDNITVIVLKIGSSAEDTLEDTLELEIEDDKVESEDAVPGEQLEIPVEYDTEDGSYHSFIKAISIDGVFIETGESIYVGQEIFMSFSLTDEHGPLMINGTVTDRRPEGIQVKFESLSGNELDMIRSFLQK